MLPIRDKTAITGVGSTRFSKDSGTTEVALATEAALLACEDAGLLVDDLDGLVTAYTGKHGMVTDTPVPFEMVEALGMRQCNFQVFDGLGGAWTCAAIMAAAMAVHSGVCRHVLIYRAVNGRSAPDRQSNGVARSTSGPEQWLAPFGFAHGASYYGPAVTAHMARFGTTNEDFAHLAVTQRDHAIVNTKAQMRKPLTVEEHQESPWIVYPFRLFDCCLETDGGVALIVSGAEEARELRHTRVLLTGMQGGALYSDTRAWAGRPLWTSNCQVAAEALYRGAGLTAEDVDFAELYDPFTGVCLLHIEGFGLTPEGTAAAAIRDGEAGLDGRIPLNTHGGLLSEAHTAGFGHVIEAVQQLREGGVPDDLCEGGHDYDRSRCRQLRDPEVGLVCSPFGESSILLKRAA